MPSTWTPNLRLEKQAAGENVNTWGDTRLNNVIQRVDFAIAGMTTKALSGNYTLTSSNGDDEARAAILKFTGTGSFTVTVPSVSKVYHVLNACTGELILTTGAGDTVSIAPDEVDVVVCDGTDIQKIKTTSYDGVRITNVGTPTAPTDAANKGYVDLIAFTAVDLPGQTGNAGKFLTTDGSASSWASIQVADVTGAAPLAAPSFTDGVEVDGGLDITGLVTQTGGTVANVAALAALDIDFSVADGHTKAISSNSTFTFSGLVAGKLQCALLTLTITSSAVPSWPASVRHPTGVNPSTSLGNGKHLLGLITSNGGTDVVLVVLARNFS